jgi:hypothetical protein
MQFVFIARKVITDSDFKVNASAGNARLVSATLRRDLSNTAHVSVLVVAMPFND